MQLTSRSILPQLTIHPKYTNRDTWNTTFNPLTPAFPSQHRFLILRYARDLSLNATPKTALTTQDRLNTHKFNAIISPPASLSVLWAFNMSFARADLRSGDERQLFRFTMPVTIYDVSLLLPSRFQNLMGGENWSCVAAKRVACMSIVKGSRLLWGWFGGRKWAGWIIVLPDNAWVLSLDSVVVTSVYGCTT